MGDEENQAINSSRESVMCIARSCITNGALDLTVQFVAVLANPLPISDDLYGPGRVEEVGVS